MLKECTPLGGWPTGTADLVYEALETQQVKLLLNLAQLAKPVRC